MEEYVKPPLGIMPRYMWNELRFQELNEAIERYYLVDKEIPTEWMDERLEIKKELLKEKNKKKGY